MIMKSLTNYPSDCLKSLTNEEIMVYNFRAYVSPLLAFIGIPANIFVIIIFNILENQQTCRFNLYAIWMALAHLIQLIVNTLIDDFLGRGLKWATDCYIWYQVDSYSSFTCKLLTYLSDVSALIASFILMLFSIDRVCSIYCAKQVEQILDLRIAKLSIFIIYVICFLLNIPHLIYADLKDDSREKSNCQYVDPVAGGVKYVLYLYIIGVTILPAILIFIMNILISCKLKSTIKRSKLNGYHDRQSYSELSKVITHLAISIMFTCLSIPLVALMILRQKVHFNNYELIYPIYAYKIIQLSKLFSSVDSFNHAFDFFLYWAFLPVFRQTLYKLITNMCSKILCNCNKKRIINQHHNSIINSMNISTNNNANIILNNNSNHRLINSQNNNITTNNNNHYNYDLSDLPCYSYLDFPLGYFDFSHCSGRCSPHSLYYYQHYRTHRHRRHHHRHHHYQYHQPHDQYYQKRQQKSYQLEYSKQLSFHCMKELHDKHFQNEQQYETKISR
ncbi:unnamed protein product [Schistosoma mattheei]|uniref:G_PROTEIN_RECEP_F1_2 domain-containing protein n=2 Tax=Schistosoma mattheei TaxID=31246 RepID=A0AA85BTE8_9TREM|nr:unnamed protein product [Schistosoma mattheei]